jgi:predicted nuclease of predicted toxin-antitoxin system
MRFLADESCDFAVVRALRSEGHDVKAVSEFQQRSIDRELIELAHAENRILLTEDKDFGWLVFVAHMKSPGVILIRFPAPARRKLDTAIRRLLGDHGSELENRFVVLQPGSVRIGPAPLKSGVTE